MPKINHTNLGEVAKTVYLLGEIVKIYYNDDTCDLTIGRNTYEKVPFFYHCNAGQYFINPSTADGYELRPNGAIKYGSTAFNEDESVIVQCEKKDSSPAIPQRIVGVEKRIPPCSICKAIVITPEDDLHRNRFTADGGYVPRSISLPGYELFPNNLQYSFGNSVTFSVNIKYEGQIKILFKLRQCIYCVSPIHTDYRPGFNGPLFYSGSYPFVFDYFPGMPEIWLKNYYYNLFNPPNPNVPQGINQVVPFLLEYTGGYYVGHPADAGYNFFKWTLPDGASFNFPTDDPCVGCVNGYSKAYISALDYPLITTPGAGGTDYSMKLEFLGISGYPSGGGTYVQSFMSPLVMTADIYVKDPRPLYEPPYRYCTTIQGVI